MATKNTEKYRNSERPDFESIKVESASPRLRTMSVFIGGSADATHAPRPTFNF